MEAGTAPSRGRTHRQWIDLALAVEQMQNASDSLFDFLAVRHILEGGAETEQGKQNGKIGNEEVAQAGKHVRKESVIRVGLLTYP